MPQKNESNEHIPLTEAIYYILLALHQSMHGYAIIQYVKEISRDRVQLGPGTLYGAIKSMVEKGWIEPIENDSDSRRKEYKITELGKTVVRSELGRLEELVINGQKIIRGDSNDN
ncbi:PadR family transcriptional regulator [Sutcliffiella deserti]|uniref:PadR family transcriptional regulator n=1 Tax=Sutcliffiella deserti TaxID=2875501 RepID=UPI001CBD8DB1|nr:helix-turn-helix transcriptional regulator [Sutcliffiella deserti]